jgi:hypothetical protein
LLPQITKPPSKFFANRHTTQLILPVHNVLYLPKIKRGKEATQTSPTMPTRTDRPSSLLLLHSLVAGAARRVDRDGTKIARVVMPIPCSRLLHPGSPEDFLDLPIVLLQHLINIA